MEAIKSLQHQQQQMPLFKQQQQRLAVRHGYDESKSNSTESFSLESEVDTYFNILREYVDSYTTTATVSNSALPVPITEDNNFDKVPTPQNHESKDVLVTGCSGFIGCHLLYQLLLKELSTTGDNINNISKIICLVRYGYTLTHQLQCFRKYGLSLTHLVSKCNSISSSDNKEKKNDYDESILLLAYLSTRIILLPCQLHQPFLGFSSHSEYEKALLLSSAVSNNNGSNISAIYHCAGE